MDTKSRFDIGYCGDMPKESQIFGVINNLDEFRPKGYRLLMLGVDIRINNQISIFA